MSSNVLAISTLLWLAYVLCDFCDLFVFPLTRPVSV